MTIALFVVICVIVVALIFDFTNGFHDSANAMAGPIATGALQPRTAVLLAAILNVVGAFLSTEVAKTISGGFFDEKLVTPQIVLAGLSGAIIWNLITWLLGLPSSSSHALFGGLIGAVIIGAGLASVNFWVVISKVLLPALAAPLVAGLAAAAAIRIADKIVTDVPKKDTKQGFRRAQAFTAAMVALAHGTSDGQKTMGVITLVLVAAGLQGAGTGPHWWVIGLAGLAIGLGTYSGGWRIMRTMGKGIVKIDTEQGAAAGAATTATILASSHLGFGLSTTHVSTGSILGSGVGRKGADVRWGVARRMMFAWLLTLPGAAIVGGAASLLAGLELAGTLILLALLGLACLVIWLISRRNQVDRSNVTDSADVLVLNAAKPNKIAKAQRKAAERRAKEERRLAAAGQAEHAAAGSTDAAQHPDRKGTDQ
ncbi:inorganic phosphate transporter [Microlunatus soli]|uniref:Phosphate transporter n=1 Tax=Microlunatus soli TaxID=630515 RepID=A0A1H1TGC2_9ACTN|nr:inorganic phosphate transporter [Microlunatus soli]SDS59345.1 inorganic phosphate transporter, PiT family [Microlunatus soli]